ncbi:MAG TPA: class I SAM-dependent methyltransferase [Steroidobacteraceae bacterium]|nr:class I SAM-dependent methyltransferase [Steroidobacteraceae bacterium]
MGLYHHCVFPYVLDLAMSSEVLRKPRQRTLARASGRILEIGFGTGMNLQHYPPDVERIEAIDPDVDLDRFSLPRIAASTIDVDFHHLNAEKLPFAKASFDTVVCTLTLCSIPDVAHALAEVRRVLRRGGQFLFLEHGLSPDPAVARWQHRLTPLQRRLGGGCHLNRDTARLVAASGLRAGQLAHYYLKRVPRLLGYMSEGRATRE